MPTHPIFETVRQHLQQGETGAALQTMITFLEAEGKQTELLRTLRVVQANYNTAKQQELKGILAFQEAQREYSKVNDALLSTIDDLSAGRPTRTTVHQAPNRNRWIIIGAAALLVVAVVAAILFFRKPKTADPVAGQDDESGVKCPQFRPADYRIMLIPFISLNDQVARPALSIQMRIRDLTRNNNISADVEIAEGHTMATSLPDFVRAKKKGDQCNANVVIWGQYEKVGDSTLVDVHYVFTEGSKVVSGHTDFHPFRSLSALQQSGKSSGLRSLDDAILSLCSIMAVHAGRPEVAEKWLAQIEDTSEKDDSLQQAITRVNEIRENKKTPKERLQERRKE